MAGIYVHIPFCKQACNYCNFHFAVSLRYKDDLLNAMIREIEREKAYLENEKINTVYFGGGTPSLLSIDECQELLGQIRNNFEVDSQAEITLEANPDDISLDKLNGWMDLGINRLSIGVQSFFEEDLKWMNRAHSSQQATSQLELARKSFDNITIDLIYGSPLLTDARWKENVDIATGLDIPHLSCYALTVEEKTPLHKMIANNKSMNVDQDKQARQFLLLMQWLKEKGYEHYEVSNFAKPGLRSRHNSSYWRGEKYLGLGPSAHSYNGIERRWNISNNQVYVKGINAGLAERETEQLTSYQKLNEYLMISLRTMEGMDLDHIEKNWGRPEKSRVDNLSEKFTKRALLIRDTTKIRLTEQGMLMADGIASDLFQLGKV
jgi:oxygen-independent coproporphyrinogen-3 oxidase